MSRLEMALKAARDTKRLELGSGALARTAEVFREQFGDRKAIAIMDGNTFLAAGRDVVTGLRCASHIFAPNICAECKLVDFLEGELRQAERIPVAVGSGTINDVTKLAAHRLDRPYMCVATAASMDGYTAYGASITRDGTKQTFDCPAPRVVIADTDVIGDAPPHMTASGYADLLAKVTAGADWIVADALGVEKIDPLPWDLVQGELREALADPEACARGDAKAIERLTEGLMMSGFAMQAAQSSRPASGAEHQLSHLWEMEHATDASHGFKVAVATVAVARLYEEMVKLPLHKVDIEAACAAWPDQATLQDSVAEIFSTPGMREMALREASAKHIDRDALRTQLQRLRDVWPDLSDRLKGQSPPSKELAAMLAAAGAPTAPEQIGISRDRLHLSFFRAHFIRRRFTVLDLAVRTRVLDECLDAMFSGEAS